MEPLKKAFILLLSLGLLGTFAMPEQGMANESGQSVRVTRNQLMNLGTDARQQPKVVVKKKQVKKVQNVPHYTKKQLMALGKSHLDFWEKPGFGF